MSKSDYPKKTMIALQLVVWQNGTTGRNTRGRVGNDGQNEMFGRKTIDVKLDTGWIIIQGLAMNHLQWRLYAP